MEARGIRLERIVGSSEVRNKSWKCLWLLWFRTNGVKMLRNKCVNVRGSK
jgi:hypothetical protein